jgi:hypothetical protein
MARAMSGRALLIRAWPLVLMALIGLVLWMSRTPDQPQLTQVACTTLASGCSVRFDGREIHFGMVGVPKPLAPFEIWLKAAGVGKVEARFVMQGMDMGFNLYTLHADSQGVFRAKVTLPICVTGRRDWAMILDVDKMRLSVPFVTDL